MVKKKTGKAAGYAEKGERGIVAQAFYDVSLPKELVEKMLKDVSHEKYLTPYVIHERYGISLSTARKALKTLAEKGVLKLYSKSRRSPVYIPVEKH